MKNEQPTNNQVDRVLSKLIILAEYYKSIGVYNACFFYSNNTEFKKHWDKIEFRRNIAKILRKAFSKKLLSNTNQRCKTATGAN